MAKQTHDYPPEVVGLVRAARAILSRPTDILNLEALMNALLSFEKVR